MSQLSQTSFWCYIGSTARTSSNGEAGIYVCRFDSRTGVLSDAKLAAPTAAPSFLVIHPSGKFLFSTAETGSVGAVAAFGVDSASGMLTAINKQSSAGAGPCHVSVDSAGKTLLVANYGSGSLASLPIDNSGALRAPVSTIQNHGSGPTKRQTSPHAHSFFIDPTNRFALACDLGIDQVLVFHLDAKTSTLTPMDPPFAIVPAGSGPRHLAFHPNGKFVYVVNELGNTVTVFDYKDGRLAQLQDIRTLPEGFTGESYTAEIRVHPSGKFLYVSNRGHDSITLFQVRDSGELTFVNTAPCGGHWPRNFEIDPIGKWLIVANERSNSLQVFSIDPASGELKPTELRLQNIPAPSCVRFMAAG